MLQNIKIETSSEFRDFNRFVQERLDNIQFDLSLEEGVAVFRAYQAELEQLRADLQPLMSLRARRVSP